MADEHPIATPVVILTFITAGIVYVFGYLRAVMHRANSDYKKTKAGLPGMRKDFWRAWWAAAKIGFWVFIAGAVLVVWAGREIRHSTPAPAATVVPSHTKASPTRSHR